MAGNTIGKLFRVTTFGESHGPGIGAIVDGCPPGINLDLDYIQKEVDRRKPGASRYTTQRREDDKVIITSGVFENKTTGCPIGLYIKNTNQRSKDYSEIKNVFRPSHADFTYQKKYGFRDYRGGGRSSARETAMRVAAGAIAKKYLHQNGIEIRAYLSQMGNISLQPINLDDLDNNDFFCPEPSKIKDLQQLIAQLRKQGDSIGAKITVKATGMPCGLGEPVFDRLDADIAHALMSINAVKGVEIGAGFNVVAQTGSEHRDEITPKKFLSNNAGGILGGISSGQDIIAHIALKPTSSITTSGKTINTEGCATTISTKGRHDPCVGIRAVPIVESMLAIVIMDHLMRHRAQNYDVINNT